MLFSRPQSTRCTWRFFKNFATLVAYFQKQAKPRPEENNVEFFEGQIHTAKLSFVHKKKSEHFFEIKILNLEQRETLALVKKFDIGRPRRPSWTKSITWRTRSIICFICKACREGCYILLWFIDRKMRRSSLQLATTMRGTRALCATRL